MSCDPRDIASKSFFLGPQAENGAWFRDLNARILSRWLNWRRERYPEDGNAISENDRLDARFLAQQTAFTRHALDLAKRFEGEIPKFSPRYMGHMFSELSLPALVGHWIATLHNPNNISSESAPVGVEIEREAIAELAKMAGFGSEAVGHFTSCGSIANFEALLRARDRVLKGTPLGSKRVVLFVPNNKHYSWVKAAHLLGLGPEGIRSVELDRFATLDVEDLERKLAEEISRGALVAMVVSVLGTTELGNLDSVDRVQDVLDRYREKADIKIWHHVDGAYGGFFLSLRESNGVLDARSLAALKGVARVDSLTIDPHKLGYVPFACGAFLCREPSAYETMGFESPYIQFPGPREPGPRTIEGSRSATGAAATWLTLKAIGSGAEGYGRIIGRTVQLREELTLSLIRATPLLRVIPHLQTNILGFTAGHRGGRISDSNQWARRFYATHSGESSKFYVSMTSLKIADYRALCADFFSNWQPQVDTDSIEVVRLTLMNPFLRSKEMRVEILEEFSCAAASACGSLSGEKKV